MEQIGSCKIREEKLSVDTESNKNPISLKTNLRNVRRTRPGTCEPLVSVCMLQLTFFKEALGQICWLEIPVHNVSRAKNFYTELFEWQFNSEPQKPVGNCVKSMHFFNRGKTLHGALLEHDEAYHVINHDPARPGAMPLLPTLCVLDCQETLDRANAIGGKTAM